MADGAQFNQLFTAMAAATLPAVAVIGRVLHNRLNLIPLIGRQMADITKRISELETKFKPNGGSSLDDVIRGIKKETESIKSDLSESRQKISGVLSTLEVHNQKHYVIWATYPDGIYETDMATGDCTWVNPALSELFGLDASNMLGRGWLRAIIPADRETVWIRWQESIHNNIPFEAEYEVQNVRTRERFRVQTTVIKTIVREGKPITCVGLVRRVRDAHVG